MPVQCEMDKKTIKRFRSLIKDAKEKYPQFLEGITLIETFSKENLIEVFYFGGFLRDLWLNIEPKDIDIVINILNQELFLFHNEKHFMGKNRFGGLKFRVNDVDIDVWSTNNSAPSNYLGYAQGINRFPETTFFNVNGIILETWPDSDFRWGWEQEFFEACKQKVLEIQKTQKTYPINFPELQLVRTYNLQRKLGWALGPELKKFISSNLPNFSPEQIAEINNERYGTKVEPEVLYKRLEELAI